MPILFVGSELEYVASDEFQHPVTRAQKRRAKHFMAKWLDRARKDTIVQKEIVKILTDIKEGRTSEKAVCDDIDNITAGGSRVG